MLFPAADAARAGQLAAWQEEELAAAQYMTGLPREQTAEQRGLRLLVGSDAKAKVYLNWKQVHKYPFPRAFDADQDRVQDITLNARLNVLVFKVVNEFNAWKGSIRFTDAQGNPVKGIGESDAIANSYQ